MEVMAVAMDSEPPNRVALVAHQDCHVRLAFERASGDPADRLVEVRGRRRRSIELIEAAFGVRPDTWYLTRTGARRAGSPRAAHPSARISRPSNAAAS
jgi:hypothetical protein